jgi:hypothetical protein
LNPADMAGSDYIEINKRNWESRVPIHEQGAGLRMTTIEEHCSVPWNPFGSAMEELPNGEFQLRAHPQRLAASYTLQAVKV